MWLLTLFLAGSACGGLHLFTDADEFCSADPLFLLRLVLISQSADWPRRLGVRVHRLLHFHSLMGVRGGSRFRAHAAASICTDGSETGAEVRARLRGENGYQQGQCRNEEAAAQHTFYGHLLQRPLPYCEIKGGSIQCKADDREQKMNESKQEGILLAQKGP
mmetsp:Transcript_8442/g.14504  ORF Transcript_8442/g.14504 Transcript_8442/m.14504 type:complete len:162 (+) Transcript_8442:245-730(+)